MSRRYERASLIVTSNKGFVDWGGVFGDPVLATAILDRLLHQSATINIKGDSFRLKKKRKAGLLGQAPEASARHRAGGENESGRRGRQPCAHLGTLTDGRFPNKE